MTTSSDGTPTPSKVVELATQRANLDGTALLGVFGSDKSPGALIRLPDGSVVRVIVGTTVAGGAVAAIAEDRIIISRTGNDLVLALPNI